MHDSGVCVRRLNYCQIMDVAEMTVRRVCESCDISVPDSFCYEQRFKYTNIDDGACIKKEACLINSKLSDQADLQADLTLAFLSY